MVVTTPAIGERQLQSSMGSMKVVIEQLQVHERIPGGIAFGEGMRLAGEGTQPITQGAVEPFHMHRTGWVHIGSQGGTDLHGEQPPLLIAMLDRLCQRQRHRNHPCRASALPSQLPLAIGSHEDALIAVPAIAEPVQLALMGPLDRGRHRSLNQVLAQWAGGAGDDEATISILDQTSPAFSLVRLLLSAVFFCTNDQNSSIST